MRRLALVAGAGSALSLGLAFAFQYLGGLAPCPLCLWQRWPHAAAIAIALVVSTLPGPMAARTWAVAGAGATATGAALGIYHSGIERTWWPGPEGCSGGDGLAGLSGAELLDPGSAQPVVLCDTVAWSFLGLSMASWNALTCLILAGIWLASARSEW